MNTIVKTADKPAIVISAYHNDAFSILHTGLKGKETMTKKLDALIRSKYADAMPGYDAYCNDLDALSKLLRDRGLSASSNHFSVTYRERITAIYGAIPVSMEGEARRKYQDRLSSEQKSAYDKAFQVALAEKKPEPVATALAVRAVKVGKAQKVQTAAGAPAGATQQHPVSKEETLEQLVARIGMFPLLDAIVNTLNVEKATQGKAKALAQLRAQLARELKPAEMKHAA